jgi:hypothetical protein
VAEAALTICAATGLAGAVLAAAGRPRSRWAMAGVVVAVGAVTALATLSVIGPYAVRPGYPPVDPYDLTVAAAPMGSVAVLAAFAAAVAWAAGGRLRAVGAALTPLVFLALTTASGIVMDARFHQPPPSPDAFLAPGLRTSGAVDHAAPILAQDAVSVLVGTPDVDAGTAGPRLWPPQDWTLGSSWTAAAPALVASLCLLAIVAATTAPPAGGPLPPADGPPDD